MNSFDHSIRGFFRDVARMSSSDPGLVVHLTRTALRQRRAAGQRRRWSERGVQVPPFMIVSVTRRCNLRCAGCFVHAQGRPAGEELSMAEFRAIFREARELGVSIVALAGGEPLTRPEILDVAADFPELMFPLITNGSLLDDATLDKLTGLRNVIPVISLEGVEHQTDERRGSGVHQKALEVMAKLRDRRIFFGTSLMVTRHNFSLVTGRGFVGDLADRGCRLFFYVDYVPIKPGTEYLIPTGAQRKMEPLAMMLLRQEFRGLFMASAASEVAYGSCMAAGSGFVHVSAEGDLEPCPFAPFSDTNLRQVPLRVALQSRFLRAIRESDEHLTESAGGCALWAKRDWVESVLVASGGGVSAPGHLQPEVAADAGHPAGAPEPVRPPVDIRRAA